MIKAAKAMFIALAISATAISLSACNQGAGERCNPLQFTDECDKGLMCVYPPGCGVAYCCPPVLMSTEPGDIPNCRACDPDDGGTTD
jgi:hypothetical protein